MIETRITPAIADVASGAAPAREEVPVGITSPQRGTPAMRRAGLLAIVAMLAAVPVRAGGFAQGWYFAASDAYGDWLHELPPGHTNHVRIWPWSEAEHQVFARRLQVRGDTVVYQVHEVAFERVAPGSHRYRLRADWKARCTEVETKVRWLRELKVLHSIYVADEPGGHWIPFKALKKVNRWWQSRGYPTMVVDTWRHALAKRPPYDYFGISGYHNVEGEWVTRPALKKRMRKAKANVLVAQSFNAPGFATPDQQGFVDLAENVQVKLVLCFLYPTLPAQGLEGVQTAPEILDAWAGAGAR